VAVDAPPSLANLTQDLQTEIITVGKERRVHVGYCFGFANCVLIEGN